MWQNFIADQVVVGWVLVAKVASVSLCGGSHVRCFVADEKAGFIRSA